MEDYQHEVSCDGSAKSNSNLGSDRARPVLQNLLPGISEQQEDGDEMGTVPL